MSAPVTMRNAVWKTARISLPLDREKIRQTPQKGDGDPQNKEHDTFEKVTLATAIAGVILLLIYTGLTGYQAYIAKDTAQRQLRAYISVAVEKHPDLNDSSPPQAVIIFKNVGQTPAYKVRARSVFSVLNGDTFTEAEAKDVQDFMDTMKGFESVQFPGQEFRQSGEPGTGLALNERQKILISMGAMTLWVNGVVNYEDAFGHPHFTRYRLFMNGAAGNRFNKMIWADQGNDAN